MNIGKQWSHGKSLYEDGVFSKRESLKKEIEQERELKRNFYHYKFTPSVFVFPSYITLFWKIAIKTCSLFIFSKIDHLWQFDKKGCYEVLW